MKKFGVWSIIDCDCECECAACVAVDKICLNKKKIAIGIAKLTVNRNCNM